MAWRAIGVWVVAFGVWQVGCRPSEPRRHVAASPDSGVFFDAGMAAEDAAVDAAPDAADIRGETPEWPEAEQEIELPYGGPPRSVRLVVTARPSALDLHLNVDTTSSMRPAIDELQVALKSNVIDRLRRSVNDVAFGVSRYADFPIEPFGFAGGPDGSSPDQPFVLLTPVTTDVARVTTAVNALDRPLANGRDIPEASAEALYQVATGAGYVRDGAERFIEKGPTTAAEGGGVIGGVGFRDFALHVVLHVADAPAHTPDDYAHGGLPKVHSLADASTALHAIGARVVSIQPTDCEEDTCRVATQYAPTRAELEALALESGASFAPEGGTCPTGIDQAPLPTNEDRCPLVYDVHADGTGLTRTIGDAVLALLDEVRFGEVHADTENDRLHFITEVRAEPVVQPAGVKAPATRDQFPRGAPDGVPDSYVEVERQSQLGFRVTLQNQHIAPRDVAQRFRVAVAVVGDSVLVEQRLLRVVVPAQPPAAMDP